ncbi:hypothetical protein KPH14_000707, partial [Odynerus spinipes]
MMGTRDGSVYEREEGDEPRELNLAGFAGVRASSPGRVEGAAER